MGAIQIECRCAACNNEWFFLPFEEARLVRAEIMRYEVRGGGRGSGWRRRERPVRSSGCGCGDAGCLFLEGFACAEMFDGCGCLGCSTLPLGGLFGLAWLAPITHLFTKLVRRELPHYHRACPACGYGLFERKTVMYQDGKPMLLETLTQLPVVNSIVRSPLVPRN